MTSITDTELREQYERAGLASVGIGYERALSSPVIVLSLIAAIKGRRRIAARQAQWVAIQYQNAKEAA